MTEPVLSAVVACYKDADAIPLMHRRLTEVFSALQVDYEIIFVNDGSPDHTDSVLSRLTAADDHVLAVEHSRNFGSQNAFVSGMQIATGSAVILLDGDLQDPPELIPAFHQRWLQGYEVVYGRRRKREGSVLYALLCRAFYRVFRRVSYVSVPLHAGDFALLDRKVVNELLAFPETDQFLRGLRAWVGFKQIGVEYVRPEREFGRSNHGFVKNVWWAKKAIFSFSFFPLELLGYAGAAMTALSVCALAYRVFEALRHPGAAPAIPGVIIAIAFFGSLNLVAMAVLGEYLIRIFEEVKRRPKFIRKALRHGGAHFNTAAKIDSFLRRRARKVSGEKSRIIRLFESDEA